MYVEKLIDYVLPMCSYRGQVSSLNAEMKAKQSELSTFGRTLQELEEITTYVYINFNFTKTISVAMLTQITWQSEVCIFKSIGIRL
jgi:hypothetical protein